MRLSKLALITSLLLNVILISGLHAVYGDQQSAIENYVVVGKQPLGIGIDQDLDRVFVANSGSNSLSILDLESGNLLFEVALGVFPSSISVAEDEGLVFVTHGGPAISIINGSNGAILETVRVGRNVIGLASEASKGIVYVGEWNYPRGAIIAIDSRDANRTKEYPLANASENLALNPLSGRIYMPNGDIGPTFVINATDMTVIDYIETPLDGSSGGYIAVNAKEDLVYLIKKDHGTSADGAGMSIPSGILFIVDGKTNAILSNLTLTSPSSLAVDEIRNRVYVTNSWSNILYVLDGTRGEILAQVNVGESPAGVAINKHSGEIAVANFGSDTISIFHDPASIPEFPVVISIAALAISTMLIINARYKILKYQI